MTRLKGLYAQVYQVTGVYLSLCLYPPALTLWGLWLSLLCLSLPSCLQLSTDSLTDWLPLQQLLPPLCGLINVISF